MDVTWDSIRYRYCTKHKADEVSKTGDIKGDLLGTKHLTKLKSRIQALFFDLEHNHDRSPTKDEVIECLTEKKPETKSDVFSVFDKYLSEIETKPTKTGLMRQTTINRYKSVKNFLEAFQKDTGYKIEWNTLDNNFYGKYREYRIKGGLSPGSFGEKDVKSLKAFLEWAFDRDYPVNPKYRKWERPRSVGEVHTLKPEEILDLWDISTGKSKIDLGRDVYKLDIFLMMVSTCFRISDMALFNPSWIQDFTLHEGGFKREKKLIVYRAYKTNGYCYCPFEDELYFRPEYLYNKYEGKFPKISGQKLNQYLRALSKRLKLSVELTAHVARKTGATQRRRQGMSLESLMKITGHSEERTLRVYLGLQVEDLMREQSEKSVLMKVS